MKKLKEGHEKIVISFSNQIEIIKHQIEETYKE